MKIFSKFHDYYDSVLGYGIDPNVVYTRKTQEYKFDSPLGRKLQKNLPILQEKMESIQMPRWNRGDDPYIDNMLFVLFCGKIYPVIEMKIDQYRNNVYADYKDEYDFLYNTDGIKKFYEKYKKKLPVGKKEQKFMKKRGYGKTWPDKSLSERNFNRFFSDFPIDQKTNNKVIDLHFEFDSPIILVRKFKLGISDLGEIIINPELNRIKFVRFMDAFTVFQELSMFIGGVMGGKIPKMVEISNDDKIAKHGFNKYSFRKDKKNG